MHIPRQIINANIISAMNAEARQELLPIAFGDFMLSDKRVMKFQLVQAEKRGVRY